MNKDVRYYIHNLGLKEHPEGGYYKEVYRSTEIIKQENLPKRFKGNRNISTSIYFLLDGKNISHFHKIKSDEIWHFYDGSTIKIYSINNDGNLSVDLLGKDLRNGESLQVIIKRDTWFCAEVDDKKSFALVGCTVSPGFDFGDFILGDRNHLIQKYPNHKRLIKRFTKE